MTTSVRRVVTGHDANGRAHVVINDVLTSGPGMRPGASACVVWTTDTSPANNDGDADAGQRKVGTTLPGGTVFRVITYQPGVAPRRHRTSSIDYIAVLSGEIWMQLDDTEVHLKQGDVLVQRGTVHNWVNRGTVPCTIACVLVDAHPAHKATGEALEAHG